MLQSPVCLTPARKSKSFGGCQAQPNGEGGLHTQNVSTILDNNTAAGWVNAAMKLNNAMPLHVVYHGQQTNGTSGAQTHMHGGRSYLPLDDILPPPHGDMIKDIEERSDNDAERRHTNQRSFQTMKTGFQKFETKPQRKIVWQQ